MSNSNNTGNRVNNCFKIEFWCTDYTDHYELVGHNALTGQEVKAKHESRFVDVSPYSERSLGLKDKLFCASLLADQDDPCRTVREKLVAVIIDTITDVLECEDLDERYNRCSEDVKAYASQYHEPYYE